MYFIGKFKGYLAFLSNFFESPFEVNRVTYQTVEHYYQSSKCVDFKEKLMIQNAETPSKAKRLGKKVKIRQDWDIIKDSIMYNGVFEKFRQNVNLAKKLILIDDSDLVEENNWGDLYWGVDIDTKEGQDKLGAILRRVKKEMIILLSR